MNSNCSNLLYLRNLQEKVKKAFCYQKLFWPFTVWINCSSDPKKFENSRPSDSNFKSFSRSVEHFFLTVGQNNFGNKIPLKVPNFRIKLKLWLVCQACRLHMQKKDSIIIFNMWGEIYLTRAFTHLRKIIFEIVFEFL